MVMDRHTFTGQLALRVKHLYIQEESMISNSLTMSACSVYSKEF